MPSTRTVVATRVALIALVVGGALALAGDATLADPAAVPTSHVVAAPTAAAPATPATRRAGATATPEPSPGATPSPTLVPSASPAAAGAATPTAGAATGSTAAGRPTTPAGTASGAGTSTVPRTSASTSTSTSTAAGASSPAPSAAPAGTPRVFSTRFGGDENPLSQGGQWINGGATGLDWTDVRVAGGMAVGTQTGAHSGTPQQYDDSTAVLAGTWGPNQMAQATVHILAVNTGAYEEVELRLRTTVRPHSITGYEIDISDRPAGDQPYVSVVRWNGPLASYTMLGSANPAPGLQDGDVVKATIVGSTISVFINGRPVLEVDDGIYASGSPGIGFFLQAPTGTNANYGFTTFQAQDGL